MFFDNHNIEIQWLRLKELFKEYEEIDNDIYSFLKRRNKTAAKRLRKKLLDVNKLSLEIRKKILYQNKENISDYENY
jgi:hypothetical protein